MSRVKFSNLLAITVVLFLGHGTAAAVHEDWVGPVTLATDLVYNPRVECNGDYVHVVYQKILDDDIEIWYRRSTDGGLTWEAENAIAIFAGWHDQVEMTTYGNYVHICWAETGDDQIFYRRNSSNGDPDSWGTVKAISSAGNLGDIPDISAGHGQIYNDWRVSIMWRGLEADRIWFATSSDQGATWSNPFVAYTESNGNYIEDLAIADGKWATSWVVWEVDTATNTQVKVARMGYPYYAAQTLWTVTYPDQLEDIAIAANWNDIYVSRDGDEPSGPKMRVSHNHGDTWDSTTTIGGGGAMQRGSRHDAYEDYACNTYIRTDYDPEPDEHSLCVSTGPSTEEVVDVLTTWEVINPDIAGNGDCGEMHVVVQAAHEILYYRYVPPPTLEHVDSLEGANEADAAWGDVDGDGDPDLIRMGEESSGYAVRTYRNNNGTLVEYANTLPNIRNHKSSGGLAWGDYDNDGDLDLALSGHLADNSKVTRIYRNDGSGDLTWDQGQHLYGVSHSSVAWGDYDLDGDLDLVITGHDGTEAIARLYRNHPLGHLTPVEGVSFEGLYCGSADWADYDGDGDLDLLMTGHDGTNPRTILYENDPVGTLTDTGTHGLESICYSDAEWGDYDGDGDLDLAIAGENAYGGPRCSCIYRNDAGTLTRVYDGEEIYQSSCAWGDFDNDGDLDIAFCGYTGSSVPNKLYKNTGGTFEHWRTFISMCNGDLIPADVDQDDDLDLFMCGNNGSMRHAYLYKSSCGAPNSPPAAPSGLSGTDTGGGIQLSWSAPADDNTASAGLYYALRVGTAPGMHDVVSGVYGTPMRGNVGQATQVTLDVPPGIYYWSVRAIDSAFSASTWATEQITTVQRDWFTHDVGNCLLTVTDQGALGFMGPSQTEGDGFVYPRDGANQLYIGSLWVGDSQEYVANRDYGSDPTAEWVVSTAPDGHVRVEGADDSDQDAYVVYNDDGAAAPRGLLVQQESQAYNYPSVADDVIMIRYTVSNDGTEPLTDVYVGCFLDFDIGAQYADNMGATEEDLNLVYLYDDAEGVYAGVSLLQDESGVDPPLGNLTLVDDSMFTENPYIPDENKYQILSAAGPDWILTNAPEPDDYRVLASAGPFALAVDEEITVAFAIVGAGNLEELKQNAHAARLLYWGGRSDAPDVAELTATAGFFAAMPNPFSRDTMIRFKLSEPADVSLAIYDVTGRQVRGLQQSFMVPSVHSVRWDGCDDSGLQVADGIYFVRLVTGLEDRKKRVIRVR